MVSVTTTPLWQWSMNAAIDNKEMNGRGCVPRTLYLEKQAASGWTGSMGHS